MAFSSGTYSRLYSWQTDAANGINITDTRMDAEFDGIATALSTCLLKDGTQTVTANIPMSTYKFTGLGSGSARTDSVNAGQLQDGLLNWVDGGGTADAITATYAPAITTLVDGQLCFVRATAANATTTPTFAPSGLTARTIVKNGGAALAAGDIVGDGHQLILRYDLANTRWELLNPNAGTGDVAGPASATADAIALFSGTGGKTIKDSGYTITAAGAALLDDADATAQRTTLGLGTAAIASTGTSAGNVVVLDGSARLPAVDGSQLTRVSDTAARDMAATALALADASGTAGQKGNFYLADPFTADTLAVATNATYDATNDWYSNELTSSYSNPGGTGNRTASITVSVSPAPGSGSAAALVNGTTDGVDGILYSGGQTGLEFIFDFGDGNTKTIQEAKIYLNSDGFSQGTFQWSGSNNGVDYTNIGGTFTLQNTVTGANGHCLNTTMSANVTAYRYYKCAQTAGTAANDWICEFEFKILGSVSNMTLRPTAQTLLTADPTDLMGYFRFDPVDSVSYGTDVVGKLSIDGGSTWAVGTWTQVGTLGGAAYEVWRLDADVDAQTGSSVIYEITTANSKQVRFKQSIGTVPLY